MGTGLSGDRVEWGHGSGPGSIGGIHLGGKQEQLRLDPVDKSTGSRSGAEQISVLWLGMEKRSWKLVPGAATVPLEAEIPADNRTCQEPATSISAAIRRQCSQKE